jgi:hypothetical protein
VDCDPGEFPTASTLFTTTTRIMSAATHYIKASIITSH